MQVSPLAGTRWPSCTSGVFAALLTFSTYVDAAPLGYFSNPVPVLGLESTFQDASPSISSDGLTMVFSSTRPDGLGGFDLYMATRSTPDNPFDAPFILGDPINGPFHERSPNISTDGLTLLFASDRTGGVGLSDIFQATRASTADSFGNVMNLGEAVNTIEAESDGSLSPDGMTLYFHSLRDGGHGDRDLWAATRNGSDQPFGDAFNLGDAVNTAWEERYPTVTTDELTLFFSSVNRPGREGIQDIWVTTRESKDDLFGEAVNLNEFSLGSVVNSMAAELTPSP